MSIQQASLSWRDRFAGSGVALMVASVTVAPMIDIFAKLATATVPAAEITLGRFIVQAALMLPFAMLRGRVFSRSVRHASLHLLRGLILTIGMISFVYALKSMPIADAIAIFFVEPAILTLMSAVFLREQIGWKKIAACATGFAGALLVIQPSFSEFGLISLLPVVTAFTVATFILITRALAHIEDPWSMQFQSSFWAILVSAAILLIGQGSGSDIIDPVMPDARALVLMACVGMAAALSGIFGAYAYRAAPASVLAPLQYLEIVSAAILAYFVFGDFPDALKWLGIAIIVASGVFIIVKGDQPPTTVPDAVI
ncbi:MAG: DMT family transporter [Rhizobium sp.]|nr:DMT family transporter [Rhizobium sp.]